MRTARALGRRTFAHCSGMDGLKIAVAAGIDSVEHGVFMERDVQTIFRGVSRRDLGKEKPVGRAPEPSASS